MYAEANNGAITALATIALVVSTIGLWIVTRKATDTAARALTVLERPWLITSNFEWAHAENERVIFMDVENAGRSPAFISSYRGGGRAASLSPEAVESFNPDTIRLKTIELPLLGSVIVQDRKDRSTIEKGGIDQKGVSAILAGAAIFYERGVIRYTDIFGDAIHETAYCLRYDAPNKKFVEFGGRTYNYVR